MNSTQVGLLKSLVGSSIDFSFKKNCPDALKIDHNIKVARNNITRDIGEALKVGGELCVMLIAELTNHYMNERYYTAVRSAISMKRYRPVVLEYLKLSVEERASRLRRILSEETRRDKNRDLKITIARYFFNTYPCRLHDFRKLLTKEEFIIVS